MRGIKFVTGHMVYNLAYNEILQLKATKIPSRLLWHKCLKATKCNGICCDDKQKPETLHDIQKLVKIGVLYIWSCTDGIYFNRDTPSNDLYTITLLMGQSKQYVCFLCQNCVSKKDNNRKVHFKGY